MSSLTAIFGSKSTVEMPEKFVQILMLLLNCSGVSIAEFKRHTLRAFPKAKNSVACSEFVMGSKFHFSNEKISFPNSFSLTNY